MSLAAVRPFSYSVVLVLFFCVFTGCSKVTVSRSASVKLDGKPGSTPTPHETRAEPVAPSGLTLEGAANGVVSVARFESLLLQPRLTRGDAPITYLLSPTLPAGISFSALTGQISGSASAVVASQRYTLVAENSAGRTELAFFLEITAGPMPTVVSITPNRVSAAGPKTFTVRGTRFEEGMSVSIGGIECTALNLVSATELTCQSGEGEAGPKAVAVTTIAGTATLNNFLEFVGAPQIISLVPARGPLPGGNLIAINGANFEPATSVTVAGLTCQNPVVVSSSLLTCTVPANAAGAYSVSVTSLGGTGTRPQAYLYAPAFTSRWKTDNPGVSSSTQVKLPLAVNGSYDFTVFWGDGRSDEIVAASSAVATHQYAQAGTYHIAMVGTINGFTFGGGDDVKKLLEISQFGPLRLGNNGAYFRGATNLTITATDPLDLTGTTTLYAAFSGCTSLTSAPSMASWDTSGITSLEETFRSAENFNQDISQWDTSSVINMTRMFFMARKFNSPIGDWNLSSVTSIEFLFYNANVFNQPVGNWDTSNVTTMRNLFSGAYKFNQPIGGWNTSKVVDMRLLFQNAYLFNQPIGDWNFSSVEHMGGMFLGASAFNQPLDKWDTSRITDMSDLFRDASSFNQPIGNWNTSKVTVMASTFYGASNFNQSLAGWDTSEVYGMAFMFASASRFNQPLGSWNTSKLRYTAYQFQDATDFNQPLNQWNVSAVSDVRNMFQRASSFNQPLNEWNVTALRLADGFAAGAAISTPNYDATLKSWSEQSVMPSVVISFGASRFTTVESGPARALLMAVPNQWVITDGGGI